MIGSDWLGAIVVPHRHRRHVGQPSASSSGSATVRDARQHMIENLTADLWRARRHARPLVARAPMACRNDDVKIRFARTEAHPKRLK
jgi:hypothetical protein